MVYKNIFPVLLAFFYFLNGVLCSIQVFNSDIVPFVYFFLLLLVHLVSYLINYCLISGHKDVGCGGSYIISPLWYKGAVSFFCI